MLESKTLRDLLYGVISGGTISIDNTSTSRDIIAAVYDETGPSLKVNLGTGSGPVTFTNLNVTGDLRVSGSTYKEDSYIIDDLFTDKIAANTLSAITFGSPVYTDLGDLVGPGLDGSSGTSGVDGSSGTSGVDGTSGVNGLDGSSGTSGVDGLVGNVVSYPFIFNGGTTTSHRSLGWHGNTFTVSESTTLKSFRLNASHDGEVRIYVYRFDAEFTKEDDPTKFDGQTPMLGTQIVDSWIDIITGDNIVNINLELTGSEDTPHHYWIGLRTINVGTTDDDGILRTLGIDTLPLENVKGVQLRDARAGNSNFDYYTQLNTHNFYFFYDSKFERPPVDGKIGTSGIDGTSGLDGSSGTSGIDGTSGVSGTSGTDGTSFDPNVHLEVPTAKIGSSSGYTEFESDGTIRFGGKATVWLDSMVSPTVYRTGGTSLPLVELAGGIYAHRFDHSDAIHFDVQLNHGIKTGSTISPHVHLVNKDAIVGSADVTFTFTYSWANINQSFTTPQSGSTTISFADASALTHRVLSFDDIIPTSAQGGISSILIGTLERLNTGYDTNNIFLLGFDIHYEVDTIGSREEFTK